MHCVDSARPALRSERLGVEVWYYVPWPTVQVDCCRSMVPFHGFAPDILSIEGGEVVRSDGPPFRAPRDAERIGEHADGYGLWPRDGRCPACRGAVVEGLAICEWCSRMNPGNDENAAVQRRVADAQRASEEDLADERSDRAEVAARVKSGDLTLTEVQRRRIWNGYKGGIAQALRLPDPSAEFSRREMRFIARAVEGRAWLMEIDQQPDFNLILDDHGNPVGRWSEGGTPPE